MHVWAPGRINLIGEHTDYSGGLALPAAIELGLSVQIHEPSDQIRLFSDTFGAAHPFAADGSGPPAQGWARYGQAVAAELDAIGRSPVGLTASISSSLPPDAGLSSSAALEVAIALALCSVADFHVDPFELAQACRRAEQRAVGVPCGILDQAACVFGEEDAAILIDCASLQRTLVPVPAEAAFLVIDSGVSRRLEDTGYATRRSELEMALAAIGVESPRELTIHDLEPLEPRPARRLRHVITENERVRQFATALDSHDLQLAGRIMSASHESLRADYEVSLPEIDRLVDEVQEYGALGARLLGGGFGGAVIALVETPSASEVDRRIGYAYPDRPAPNIVHASAGASVCVG
jgi:galactokinase